MADIKDTVRLLSEQTIKATSQLAERATPRVRGAAQAAEAYLAKGLSASREFLDRMRAKK